MKVRLITGAAPRKDDGPNPEWLAVLRPLVRDYLDAQRPDLVIVGCAEGVDEYVRGWCDQDGAGVDLLVGKALWRAWRKGAGPRRNTAIAVTAEGLAKAGHDVAFLAYPGAGNGTHDAVRKLQNVKIRRGNGE